MYQRKQIFDVAGSESVFFWGARETGKSTLLKQLFPGALWFDLRSTEEYITLLNNPGRIREAVAAAPSTSLVVIDEIQRMPELLAEVHWLIANKNIRFIMIGSNPRKLLRPEMNLFEGKALRYELYPLTTSEIPDLDLLKALNDGLLPKHYDTPNARPLLSAYIENYFRDEIVTGGHLKNTAAFRRFLEVAALTNGEIVNYANVAAKVGVSLSTVKAYFQILEDTLLGRYLPAFRKQSERRTMTAAKCYLFDVGIVNTLLNRWRIQPDTELFDKAFKHFIYEEIYAHSRYSGLNYPMAYWQATPKQGVSFVLGDHEVSIDVKPVYEAKACHLHGLKAFAENYSTKKQLLVSNNAYPRQVNDILILPWQTFLQQLWGGEIVR
jgi:predicted AAA+ superfamily ATPase